MGNAKAADLASADVLHSERVEALAALDALHQDSQGPVVLRLREVWGSHLPLLHKQSLKCLFTLLSTAKIGSNATGLTLLDFPI